MNNWVLALTVFDDGGGPALYAGGGFTTAGGVRANRIARWDGSTWSALGSGMNGTVWALTVFDDGSGPGLYAGGLFSTAGDRVSGFLARWSGTWGEFNGESPFDLYDWPSIADCLQGPTVAAADGCACADPTRNGHIDLRDVAALQIGFRR